MSRVWLRAGVLLLLLFLSVPTRAQPTGLPDDLAGDHEAQGFADLLFAHGMIELAEEDYEAALPLLEKASQTMPTDGTYEYFAAFCKLQLGQYGEAAEGFQRSLPPAVSRIGEARIRYDLGDSYYRIGELQKAQKELRRSTAIDDRVASAHYYQGLVDFVQGDTEPAFEAFSKAAELDPSYAEQADFSQAVAAYEAGKLDESRGHFEKALKNTAQSGIGQSSEWLNYLNQAEDSEEVRKTALRFTFLLEHDDNPGQVNEDVTIPDVGSDVRAVVQGRAAYRPWIKENSTVGFALVSYTSHHDEFDEADLSGIQAVVNYAIAGDPSGYISGPLGYARVSPSNRRVAWLFQAGASNLSRDEGSLRRDYELASTVLVQQGDFGKSEASVTYDDVTYFDEFNRSYSGHATGFRVGQYIFLGGETTRFLRLSIGGTQHHTREVAFERDSIVYQAEASLPLNDTFHLFLLGNFREDDYDDASQNFYQIARSRADETIEAIAKMTMSLNSKSFLTFSYSFAERDSRDLEFASYDRRIASVGYTRQW